MVHDTVVVRGFHGYCGYQWLCMDFMVIVVISGCAWISMVISCYAWLLWLSVVMHGYQWLYAWLLTLGAHAQRGLRYLVCVCVCVCVSVTQHLTFYVFIRATNDTNLLGGG